MKKKVISGIIAVVVIIITAISLYYLMKDVREESRADEKRAEELNSSGSAIAGTGSESELQSDRRSESFYGKLSKGQRVNILVLGDSIGAGVGLAKDEQVWSDLFATKLQEEYGSQVKMKNKAEKDTTTYAGYTKIKTMRDSTDYDLVILCYGNRESTGDYSLYGECLVRAARDRYPGCSIMWMKESGMSDMTGKEEALGKMEKQYRFSVADTVQAMSQEDSDAVLDPDRGLMSAKGQMVYANQAMKAVQNRIQFGIEDKRGDISCLDDMAGRYVKCQYVYAKKLHRPDSMSFVAKGSAYAVVGLDMDYKKGDSIKFYVDDVEIPVHLSDFSDRDEQRLYVPIIDVINIQKSIKVTFNSKEAAKRFRGFIINNVSA